MENTKELKKALASDNVREVQMALSTYVELDYANGTADALSLGDKAAERLRGIGKKLYEADDGDIPLTQKEWDRDVWKDAVSALMINFSREKLEFITELVSKHRVLDAGPRRGNSGRAAAFAIGGAVGGAVVGGIVGALFGGGKAGRIIGAGIGAAIGGIAGGMAGSRM